MPLALVGNSHVGERLLNSNWTFYIQSLDTGGSALDADAVPSYSVYEEETGTAIVTGSMAKLDDAGTTGFYSEQVALSDANGYELHKDYCCRITATVDGQAAVSLYTLRIGPIDAIRAETAQAGAAGTITLDAGASATDDFYNGLGVQLIGGTGDGQVRLITDYVGSTKVATVVPNWTTTPGATSIFLLRPWNGVSVAFLEPGTITASAIATGAIDADAVATDAVTEIRSVVSGTSDSGSTTTMVDAARTEADTDYWKGAVILFTSGTISGQARLITGFNAATDTITFAPATTQAVSTQTYEILPQGGVDLQLWRGSVPNGINAGRVDVLVTAMDPNVITATVIAADAIGASELAADAVAEIQAGLATAAAVAAIQADTDDIQARLPATLNGGRMRSHVEAMDAGVITAAVIATDAIDADAIAANAIDAAVIADGAIDAATFAAGAIDAAAIANGAIDAATFAAGAIDAAAIATDAIDADAIAASAVAEIQAGLATAASVAAIQADTDDIQTRLPATLVGGRMRSHTEAMDAGVITAAVIATGAIDADALATDAVNEIAAATTDQVWDESTVGHNISGTFGQVLFPVRAGTAQAGAATTITLDAAANANDDYYTGALIFLTGGTGALQGRSITDYVGATKVATVSPAWVTNPDVTSVFVIVPAATVTGSSATPADIATAVWAALRLANQDSGSFGEGVASVQGNVTGSVGSVTGNVGGNVVGNVNGNVVGSVGSVAAGGITAASIATDAIDADAIASSAVTEIQAGLATSAAVAAVQADTDDIQARLPATLVGGRMRSHVEAMDAGVITAAVIATDAIDSDALAASAVAEIQAGLATAASVAAIQADTDDIQTRLPATLNGGRMRSHVEAIDAGPLGQISDGVWDEPTAGHNTTGTFGQVLFPIRAGTAQAGTATTITLDVSASAVDDYYNGMLAYWSSGAGDIQARSITDYVGATKVATVSPAWAVNPAAGNAFVILPEPTVTGSTSTPADVADAVWDEATSGHLIAGTFGQAQNTIRSGTAQGGGGTTITLDAGASAIDDFYNFTLVFVTGGTGAGQSRMISDYVGATKVATVNTAWGTNPDATSVFVILPFGSIPGAVAPSAADNANAVWDELTVEGRAAGSYGQLFKDNVNATISSRASAAALAVVQADTDDIQARLPATLNAGRMRSHVEAMDAGTITAAVVATGAIDADALATDAVNEIVDQTWDEILADHLGIGSTGEALNNAGSGASPALIADAVWDENIVGAHGGADTAGEIVSQLTKRAATPFGTEVILTSVLGQMSDKGGGTFDRTTDSLEGIRDAIAGGGADPATIAGAVWQEPKAAHQGETIMGNIAEDSDNFEFTGQEG